MRRLTLYGLILFIPLLPGQTPGYRTVPTLQQELPDLTRRGYTYRYLDNNLIELTEPATGSKHIKSLATTDEATIRAWAQQRGVPVIEIDPSQIDTNLYAGWHQYWTEVPLFAGFGSLLLADLNQNGRVDIYGVYKDFQSGFESRVYEIDPNYPNPFNPVTSFTYAVGSSGIVTLKVYDLLGAEVAILVDEVKSSGVYTTSWEARGIAAGVYFYSLRAGAFAFIGKMILLR